MWGVSKTFLIRRFCWKILVPGTGIEPVRTDEGSTDFKSVVSTNFTTRAKGVLRETNVKKSVRILPNRWDEVIGENNDFSRRLVFRQQN